MGSFVKTASSQGRGSYGIELEQDDVAVVTFTEPVDWASGVSIHVFPGATLRGRIKAENSLTPSGDSFAWTLAGDGTTFDVDSSYVQNSRVERIRFTAQGEEGAVRILSPSDIDIEVT